MQDRLEKYLNKRRGDLDVESPDDDAIWQGISSDLQPGISKSRRRISKTLIIKIRNVAAVIVILFSLGYIANDIINGRISGRMVTLSSIDNALGRREKEYRTAVSLKTEEVKLFSNSDDLIIRQLFGEIRTLDQNYDEAMRDLKNLGPEEKVVNTIFNIYEQKIRLLELIILESNKTNSHENNRKIIL